jgi:hypothetical protein
MTAPFMHIGVDLTHRLERSPPLGNEVSSLFIDLPVSETGALRRYQPVSSEVAQLKPCRRV